MKRSSSVLCVFLCLAVQMAKAQDGVKPTNNQVNHIQFAPVFVSPTMQWAVPNSSLNGPPSYLSQQIAPGLLAVTVGIGGCGNLYDIDWVSYYKKMPGYWVVPNSAIYGPPANLSSGMMMMPH